MHAMVLLDIGLKHFLYPIHLPACRLLYHPLCATHTPSADSVYVDLLILSYLIK